MRRVNTKSPSRVRKTDTFKVLALVIDLPSRQINVFLTKSKLKKIELVAIPLPSQSIPMATTPPPDPESPQSIQTPSSFRKWRRSGSRPSSQKEDTSTFVTRERRLVDLYRAVIQFYSPVDLKKLPVDC